MSKRRFSIAIVGVGPRGLSVLERLCSNINNLSPDQYIDIHTIDPDPAGAGNVWRTDQSSNLLMNTVASQITMFTDFSVDCLGPKDLGPNLYEWAQFLTLIGFDEAYDDTVLEEANSLQPDSYPTRSFYGHYLRWVYKRLVSFVPSNVSIYTHRTRVTSLDTTNSDQQLIQFEGNVQPLVVDTIVMALGNTDTSLSKKEQELKSFADKNDLNYIAPINPADANLDQIRAKEPVILRGLGLNFFDYMALLTIGRGGRFVCEEGYMVYKPSGNEPKMYASSRRGVPYHGRGENEKGVSGRHEPLFLTNDVINYFCNQTTHSEINFKREIWPLIAKEIETVYYKALISSMYCKCQGERFEKKYCELPWGSDQEKQLLRSFNISEKDWWNWNGLQNPLDDMFFSDKFQFHHWLKSYLKRDFIETKQGNVSGPLKAALDVFRDIRNEIRLIIDHGGISGNSYRDDIDSWYTSLNAFLSIGPPSSRIEQMIALLEADVLTVIGPDMRVELLENHGRFHAYSSQVSGSSVEAKNLIEARLPKIDLRKTRNPLLKHLKNTGQCQTYKISNFDGSTYETGGLAVTPPPNRLIDNNGNVSSKRFAFGVPTEGVHWVTTAGIRPGVNSVILSESDAIAREIISLALKNKEKITNEQVIGW